MTLPRTINTEGTPAATATAMLIGVSSISGSGTMVFDDAEVSPSGDTTSLKTVGIRHWRINDESFPAGSIVRWGMWRMWPAAPTGEARLDEANLSAGGTIAALLLSTAGKLKLSIDGTASVLTGDKVLTDGEWYWVEREIDTQTTTQSVRVMDTSGVVVENMVDDAGSGVVGGVRGGTLGSGNGSFVGYSDGAPYVLSDAPIQPDIPPVVRWITSGAHTTTALEVKVRCDFAVKTRVSLYRNSDLHFIETSDEQSPGDNRITSHYFTELEPNTRHRIIAELKDADGVWHVKDDDGYDGDVAWCKTMPTPFQPYSRRVVLLGCTRGVKTPDDADCQPYSYDDIWDLGDTVDDLVHLGDIHYFELEASAIPKHVDGYSTQLSNHVHLRRVLRLAGTIYTPSDHERGPNNGETGGMQYVKSGNEAIGRCFPMHEFVYPSGAAEYKHLSRAIPCGRMMWLVPDFRNWYRTDSATNFAYEEAHPAEAGLEWRALGEGPHEALVAAAQDPAYVYNVLWSDPVPYSRLDGSDEIELISKTDAYPTYPASRADLFGAVATKPAEGFASDYHNIEYDTDGSGNLHGGFPWMGVAGQWVGVVWRGGEGWDFHLFEDDYVGFVSLYGVIDFTDDGVNLTSHRQAFQTYPVVDANQWLDHTNSTSVPAFAPEPPPPGFLRFAGVDLHYPDGGPFGITSWGRNVAAKTVPSVSLQGVTGATLIPSRIRSQPGRVAFKILVRDLDTFGVPGGKVRALANVRGLEGLVRLGPNTLELSFPGESDVWVGDDAIVSASVPLDEVGEVRGEHLAVVVFDIPHSVFRSPNEFTFTRGFSTGFDNLRIAAFDGSTAVIDDALIRVTGPCLSFSYTDDISGNVVGWSVDGGLALGSQVLIDTAMARIVNGEIVPGWKARVSATPTWDIEDGTDASAGLWHRPGRALMTLTPYPFEGDYTDWRIYGSANVGGGDPGDTVFELKARKAAPA